jgi:hypothetical protein
LHKLTKILGDDFAGFTLSKAMLESSEIDTGRELRELLKSSGLLIVDDLGNGERREFKAKIVSGVSVFDTIITIRRTENRGDRRFCVYGLKNNAKSGDKLIIWIKDGILILVTIDPVQGVNENLMGKLRSLMTGGTTANSVGQSSDIAPEDKSKMSIEDRVARLIERSYGGKDVAACPTDTVDGFWPIGPCPLCVNETIDRLSKRLSAGGDGDAAEWVFLVGGAGNGKSEVAKNLNAQVHDTLFSPTEDEKLNKAHRLYKYRRADKGEFIIINDATVSRQADYPRDRGALCKDLDDALKQSSVPCLLANINRGILLEESEHKGLHNPMTGQIIEWLMGESFSGEELDGKKMEPLGSIKQGYYRMAKLIDRGKCTAYIHVVYMDYGSLFEPREEAEPAVAWNEESTPVLSDQNKYRVIRFEIDKEQRVMSPAAQIIKQYVRALGALPEDEGECPILANLKTISGDDSSSGILEVARGCEIASGGRFSYRELWELISLLVIGPCRREFMEREDVISPLEWTRNKYREWENTGDISNLMELAQHRSHMSIFRAVSPTTKKFQKVYKPKHTPVTQMLSMVDPVKDATRDWADDVYEAMEQLQLGRYPSDYLKRKDPLFADNWHKFDALVEREIENLATDKKTTDHDSRVLRNWLGQYILRLYALVKGRPAHQNVFKAWTRARRVADSGNKNVGPPLAAGIRQMIAPRWGSSGDWEYKLILPLLSARSQPLVRDVKRPVLCYGFDHTTIKFELMIESDRLMLLLMLESRKISKLALDFLICREALAFGENENGFTEAGSLAAARIERTRSQLLSNSTFDRISPHVGIASHDKIIGLEPGSSD